MHANLHPYTHAHTHVHTYAVLVQVPGSDDDSEDEPGDNDTDADGAHGGDGADGADGSDGGTADEAAVAAAATAAEGEGEGEDEGEVAPPAQRVVASPAQPVVTPPAQPVRSPTASQVMAFMCSIKDDDVLRLLSVHGPDRNAGMGVALKCYEAKKETPRLAISGVGGLPAGVMKTNYYINLCDLGGSKAWTDAKYPDDWANNAAHMCDMLADQVKPSGTIASTFADIAKDVRMSTPRSSDASVYPVKRAQMLHKRFLTAIPAGSAVSMFAFNGVALKKTLEMRLSSSYVFFEPSQDWVIYHIFVRTVLFQSGTLQHKDLVHPDCWRRGIGQMGVSLDATTMKDLRENSPNTHAQILESAGEVHVVSAEIKQVLADLWAYDVEEKKPRPDEVQVLHTLECRLLALKSDQLKYWADQLTKVKYQKGSRNATGKRLAKIESLLHDVASRTTLMTGKDVLSSPCKPPCCLTPGCLWCLQVVFALHPQSSSGAAASSFGAAAASSCSGITASPADTSTCSQSGSGCRGRGPWQRGGSVILAMLPQVSGLDAIYLGVPLTAAPTVAWGYWAMCVTLLIATLIMGAWLGRQVLKGAQEDNLSIAIDHTIAILPPPDVEQPTAKVACITVNHTDVCVD